LFRRVVFVVNVCRWCFVLRSSDAMFTDVVLLGWIASKVKEVAPALPTASPTVVVPPINDGLPKAPGAANGIASVEKQTTRRRVRGKKKTTTASSNVAGSTAAPDNEPEGGAAKRAAPLKSVRKRSVRALGH
jgi:hypothetical protein